MNDMFTALKKAMYDYNNIDALPIRRKEVIISTYSKFANNYDFVDQLVSDSESTDNEEE